MTVSRNLSLIAPNISSGGVLSMAGGGTGTSTSTGTGAIVLSINPVLVAPSLGTPNSGDFSTGTFVWPTFPITIRSNTIASAATITPASEVSDQYNVTALAVAASIAIPTGTPIDGQRLTIRIEDNLTAQGLTWITTAGGYRVIGTTLPETTVLGKIMYIGCIYNSTDGYWDVVSVAQQA